MSRRVCEGEALLACRLVVRSPFVPARPSSLYPCQSTLESYITVGRSSRVMLERLLIGYKPLPQLLQSRSGEGRENGMFIYNMFVTLG
jgi:hypothetical protein